MGAEYLNSNGSKYQKFQSDIEGKSLKDRNESYAKLLYGDDIKNVKKYWTLGENYTLKYTDANGEKHKKTINKNEMNKTLTNTYALEQASQNIKEWNNQATEIDNNLKNRNTYLI